MLNAVLGGEWNGERAGFLSASPTPELRIESLNKMRTCIDGHSKATFIQSP